MRARGRTHHRAFTLVELLVVIVIIAILSALLLPAITGAIRTTNNAAVSADMTTLAQALAAFKEKYGDYPPSRIVLSENGVYDMTAAGLDDMVASANGTGAGLGSDLTRRALLTRSVTYLRKFWPRLAISTTDTAPPGISATNYYDFNSNMAPDPAPYVLEGDECLTFFLGGVPRNSGTADEPKWSMSGWGKSPTNPFTNAVDLDDPATKANENLTLNPMYSGNRQPPFFEFRNERLRDLDEPTSDTPARGNTRFPSYVDSLGTGRPIVYFSAYGGEAYDPNDANFGPLDSAGVPVPEPDDAGKAPILRQFRVKFPVEDSAGTVSRVAFSAAPNPYTSSTPGAVAVQWHKGTAFQLLSAGRDGLYGQGGQWDPNATVRLARNPTAETDPDTLETRAPERDNIASFAAGTLE